MGSGENHWNRQAEFSSAKGCCCPLFLHSSRRPGWRGPWRAGRAATPYLLILLCQCPNSVALTHGKCTHPETTDFPRKLRKCCWTGLLDCFSSASVTREGQADPRSHGVGGSSVTLQELVWECPVSVSSGQLLCLPTSSVPPFPRTPQGQRPLAVLAQLTLNCFASFYCFLLSCSCLFVLPLGLGLRAPGRMNF